jgi:TetR/AcrR family transcriptional regulator, repressor of fatR-cypB operon
MEQWTMAIKEKPSKRDAILAAMLDIVVERGFHDAPMSLIAQRAGASPGIIYHYFSSKEEIIKALYERIRELKRDAFLSDFDPDRDPGEMFVQVFLRVYNFYRKHQREMRFYQLCEHAGFACAADHANKDQRSASFARRFSGKSHGGVLKDWPNDVMEEMTIGLVTRLAAQQKRINEPLLREIAQSTWEMVKA